MVECIESALLSTVLSHTGGNKQRAAKILGITRGTLRNKLAALGISAEAPSLDPQDGQPIASELPPSAKPTI